MGWTRLKRAFSIHSQMALIVVLSLTESFIFYHKIEVYPGVEITRRLLWENLVMMIVFDQQLE